MTTQAPGPHVLAKKKMKIHMKAIMAETAAGSEVTVPVMATINWQMTIPNAPQTRSGRRPNLSMDQKEIGVEHTLTSVVIKLIRKGFEIVPSALKNLF